MNDISVLLLVLLAGYAASSLGVAVWSAYRFPRHIKISALALLTWYVTIGGAAAICVDQLGYSKWGGRWSMYRPSGLTHNLGEVVWLFALLLNLGLTLGLVCVAIRKYQSQYRRTRQGGTPLNGVVGGDPMA
ncbi:MAG TPA: hypothetical protein VE988_07675 [Gemmataceae bacterium]|nr:hypothetical protein [Gemmataceae bacterium]